MISMASTHDSKMRDRAQPAAGFGVNRTVRDPLTADLGEVQLDLDRQRRCGYPEAVYAEGKTVETLAKVFRRLLEAGEPVLATRVSTETAQTLAAEFPQGRYNTVGKTFRIDTAVATPVVKTKRGRVAILTAGTTDLAVAEEARDTAEW